MEDEIRILAIESSCDETAAAVVVNGRDVRSNVISSQIDIHTRLTFIPCTAGLSRRLLPENISSGSTRWCSRHWMTHR